MEDVIIIFSKQSQAADQWVSYLRTCFDQNRKNRSKPPLRILSVGIEEIGAPGPVPLHLENTLKHAKLEILIMCPMFLEHLLEYPEHGSLISRHMQPDRVLAMLLGLDQAAVNEQHRKVLSTFDKWRVMESIKDRDLKFVGEFLSAGMDIVNKPIVQQCQQNGEKCHFMLTPKKVNKNQSKVIVLLNDPVTREDVLKVIVVRNNHSVEIPGVKKRNPYTLIFRMPEDYMAVSMLVAVKIEKNGTDLGCRMIKCESRLYAMDQILRTCDSPIEFMCQALNIAPCDKEQLDEYLAVAFQHNVPSNFNLLQSSGLGHLHRGVISKDEYPTLLHFAAKFGLEKLCWQLLECPGGALACDVRNTNELTPAELAEAAGHGHLANVLCGYMKMTELTSAYTFLKGMTDQKGTEPCESDDYLNPRPLNETYQVPPSPRPLELNNTLPPLGYMPMHSPTCNKAPSVRSLDTTFVPDRVKHLIPDYSKDMEVGKAPRDGFQDELIEIINDFKNNVFTITEVEKLVENWKNRNDVQQSFREKQHQLNKMREEYERVQQREQEEMHQVGRMSPLERIRNFFRGKSKDKDAKVKASSKKQTSSKGAESYSSQRPASSLSLRSSSSSSSGRMSTGSHCSGASLGDSGTHSDTESERKFQVNKPREGLDNYDIPPSPVALLSDKRSGGVFASPFSFFDEPVCSVVASGSSSPPSDNPYCNIPPNESSLHGRLSRSLLKTVEEHVETKEVYVNLPQPPEQFDDLHLPDYVNVEASECPQPIKCT